MLKILSIFGMVWCIAHVKANLRINNRYLSFSEEFKNLVPWKKEMTHSVGLSK